MNKNQELKNNQISENTDHFSLPAPTLQPKLNIQPIHPKTNHFLKRAKNKKKSSLWFKISVFLLILSVIFISFAGVNLYAKNLESNQAKNISDCQSAVNMAKFKGIDVDINKCNAPTGWSNLFGQDLSAKNFSKNYFQYLLPLTRFRAHWPAIPSFSCPRAGSGLHSIIH